MRLFRLKCCFLLASAVLPGQGDRIRVDVNLIQIDVTVLDKSGDRVTGLGVDDFEVYQDGKRQRIQSASWIQKENSRELQAGKHKVAVFLDDAQLSFESTGAVRRALLDFSNRHVQPGDQIALIRGSGELGVMRRFSSDKRELDTAISDLSFSNWSTVQSGNTRARLHALEAIVSSLGDFSGRKSLIYISDQIQLNTRDPQSFEFVNRLIDGATRAGVVIYTIDARGLQYHGVESSEKWNGSIQDLRQENLKRQGLFLDSREGMILLAKETGGVFYGDRNDLGLALAEAIQDQDGYYLLAIQPDEATFKATASGPKFHRLQVRLKTKGHVIRHRRGFFGTSPEEEKAGAALVRALFSPFQATGLSLKVTPRFDGLFKLTSELDPKQFRFQDQPDDWKEARIDQRIVVFDPDGKKVENLLKHHRIRLRREGFNKALQDGLRLELSLKISKPGSYRIRSAVEDLGNRLRGSTMISISMPAK